MKTLTLLFICLLPSLAFAENTETITLRSAGKLIADDSLDLTQQIELSPSITLLKSAAQEAATATSIQSNRLANTYSDPVLFDLFDAWVDLSGDLDQDGYYHNIRVSFDADVNTQTTEAVYAKIYLSYQGGPWFLLSTTDLFEIYSNSANDSYEIFNELEQGFASGDYEVLIELHSLYHSGIVSQKIVQLDKAGYLITLEDLERDQPSYSVVYVDSYSYGVSGGFSAFSILLLGLMLGIKRRFVPTH